MSAKVNFEPWVEVNPGMGLPKLHEMSILRHKLNLSSSCATYC